MQNPYPSIVKAVTAISLFSIVLASAAPPEGKKVKLMVKPKPSVSEAALHALLKTQGASEIDTIHALDVRLIEVSEKAADALIAALKKNKNVEYVERDASAQGTATANDPLFTGGNQWWISKVQAPAAWDITTGVSNLPIAIVDSGVKASHLDITNKLLPGYDFVNNDSNPDDDNGHGTATAGVAAASSNNQLGMVSMAWANPVIPVKVLGADNNGSYFAIANGITWAADQGARIINLSLGGSTPSQVLQDAVNYAWNKNAVLIASAGNDGVNTPRYPAACNNVVAVSATNSTDERPSWSNYGTYVDISAPGQGVLSLYGTDTYAFWNGTSFSCPIASGTIALMASANPLLSNGNLVNLLLASTDDIGVAGYDTFFGTGRVNASAAVQAAVAAAVDTAAPTVAILSPVNGATVSGTINVSLTASDNVGVTRLELYRNGLLVSQTTSSSSTVSWNTTGSVDGVYNLEARAYDAVNNIGVTTTQVTVQNSPVPDAIAPVTAISSPANGTTVNRKSQKITVTSSDNVAVTSVRLFIDGVLFGTSTSAAATFTWNTSRVASGAHVLQSFAYDAAGNIGASTAITVYR